MAAVYAGRHRAGNRVALKYLHGRFSQDPDALVRFRREGYAANRVGHPGALPVLDDDVDDDGGVFLVMPLLVGETLRARWERLDRRLPIEEVVTFGAHTLDVLAAAHANGIVHRDIKPENLFLTSEAELFVLDFGVARVLDDGNESLATRTGIAIGTPAFMSPEQARGRSREIDGRTDVWALGATMFSLASGRYVHEAETGSEAMAFAATRPAPPMGDVAPHVAEQLRAIIDRALCYEKEKRWRDASEMRAALLAAFAETSPSEHALRLPHGPAGVVEAAGEVTEGVHDAETIAPKRSAKHESESSSSSSAPALGNQNAVVSAVPAKRHARRNAIARFILALVACLAIGGGYLLVRRRHPTQAGASPAGSPSAQVATDRTRSGNSEAEALYEAGVRLVHDARWNGATVKFERATALDESFASAHLQIAAIDNDDDNVSRKHFNQALQLRGLLSESEQSLLDAIAPAFSSPPDWASAVTKLTTRSDARPADAMATVLAASFAFRLGQFDEALTLSSRALQRDPTNLAALLVKGRSLFWQGKLDDAHSALLACTTAVPDATDCLAELNDLDAYDGRCEEAESGSRRLIALEPETALWYEYLARAAYGNSRNLDAARAALDIADERTPADESEGTRYQHRFGLAVLRGDLHLAVEELLNWEHAESENPSELYHAQRFRDLIDLYVEMGERSRAVDAAREFLKRRTTWVASRRFDLEIVGWQGLYSADGISRTELRDHRDSWFARYASLADRLWEYGYAQAPLKSSADADDVLRHRPSAQGFLMNVRTQDGYGNALRMAGRIEEALPELKRAARNCRAIFYPIEQTRANLHLGLAFEAYGDRDGACVAYATVEHRWGKVPASETARAARVRAKQLGCAVPPP